jgi:hypothetical protein
MHGATSYARIVLSLTEAELEEFRQAKEFAEIVAWLALWRSSALVDVAYQRLVGPVHWSARRALPNN